MSSYIKGVTLVLTPTNKGLILPRTLEMRLHVTLNTTNDVLDYQDAIEYLSELWIHKLGYDAEARTSALSEPAYMGKILIKFNEIRFR